MELHERIYKSFFGIEGDSFKKCEVPWCGKKFVHAHPIISHTDEAGLSISNIIGLCDEHKTKYEKNSFWLSWLKVIHLHNIINHKKTKRLC
jgi:hypothetical protein